MHYAVIVKGHHDPKRYAARFQLSYFAFEDVVGHARVMNASGVRHWSWTFDDEKYAGRDAHHAAIVEAPLLHGTVATDDGDPDELALCEEAQR